MRKAAEALATAKKVADVLYAKIFPTLITGEWSDGGGIQIDRFLGEARTRLAWVGGLVNGNYEMRPARTGAFTGQNFTARCKLVW